MVLSVGLYSNFAPAWSNLNLSLSVASSGNAGCPVPCANNVFPSFVMVIFNAIFGILTRKTIRLRPTSDHRHHLLPLVQARSTQADRQVWHLP